MEIFDLYNNKGEHINKTAPRGSSLNEGEFHLVAHIWIKNNEGKTNKFYWLTRVDTDFDLELEYKMLKDKEVYVRFMTQEIFDPRINEYRSYNVLLELNKRD